MTTDLPPGWAIAMIGDVADVQLGRQRSPQYHVGDQMRPYLRAANVTWQGIRLEDVKEMNFDDSDFETYRLEPGDILLNEASGSPNEVGKPAIWCGEIEGCCFQNTLLKLRARTVDMGYLYWYCFFSALTGRFGEAGRGVNIRHLGKRGLMRFPIAVAPPTQQQRIVAAIEERFSRLAAIEASLDAAELRCEALVKSILVGAIPNELPPYWRTTIMEEAGQTGLGRQRSPKYHSGPNMKPYLRVANVFEDRVDTSDIMEMHFDEHDFDKYRLEVGDILLNEGQSPEFLGRPAIYRGDPPDVAFTNSLIRFVPGPDVTSEWALLVFRRHMHSGRFMKESRITTNIAHLALGRFRSVEFPVPPLKVQDELVAGTRAAPDSVGRAMEQIRSATERTTALRRAVLAQAFAGQLVPQNLHVDPVADFMDRAYVS